MRTRVRRDTTVRCTNKLRVSVIIPAYQAAETIARAIESVLGQTYTATEIVVVDDGSHDHLENALRPYRRHIRYIRQDQSGVASARNRGIQAVTGDLVAFLDADDWWAPEKLSYFVNAFSRHESVGVMASRYFVLDAQASPVKTSGPDPRICGRKIRVTGKTVLDYARHVSTPSVVVRASLLKEHLFDLSLRSAEDRDLWIRLLMAADVMFLVEPLSTVELRPNSLSHGDLDQDCSCMMRVLERYSHYLGPVAYRKERAVVHYKWAAGLNPQRQAWGHLLRSICLWPLPYSGSRMRNPLARPRLFLSLARNSVDLRSMARALLSPFARSKPTRA